MPNEGIVGQCLECENFVFLDEAFENLGDGYFIHAECVPEDVDEGAYGGPK